MCGPGSKYKTWSHDRPLDCLKYETASKMVLVRLTPFKVRSVTCGVSCGSSIEDTLGRDVRPWTKIHNNSLHECSSATSKWKSLVDMLSRIPEIGLRKCPLVVRVRLPVRKSQYTGSSVNLNRRYGILMIWIESGMFKYCTRCTHARFGLEILRGKREALCPKYAMMGHMEDELWVFVCRIHSSHMLKRAP